MSPANKPTISQKMTQLKEMIAWFESDDFAIEEAVEQFEAAEKLADEIEKDLTEKKNKITVLKQKFE